MLLPVTHRAIAKEARPLQLRPALRLRALAMKHATRGVQVLHHVPQLEVAFVFPIARGQAAQIANPLNFRGFRAIILWGSDRLTGARLTVTPR